MANYSSSNFSTAQAKLIGAFQSNELRFRQPVVFAEFVRNGQIIMPSWEALRTREDRAITAYYMKRSSRSLGSARSYTHSGARGDSSTLSLSWTSYTDLFSQSLKQGDNNLFDSQTMLNNELQNLSINFAEGLETAATAYLNANKSGVNVAAVDGAFNSTTDVYEIETAKEKRGIQILKTVMDINKYSGMFMVFCDSVSWNKMNFYANQGTANSENLQFQFSGVRFVHAPELTALGVALGYTDGYMVAAPEGSISALPWIPKQNREGVITQVNKYTSFINPILGVSMAVHSFETRADDSANNGYTQDVVTEYQASLDVALNHTPLSVAGETPLLAFGFVETITA